LARPGTPRNPKQVEVQTPLTEPMLSVAGGLAKSERNGYSRARGPYHASTKQLSFVASPIIPRSIPGVKLKRRASEELERVLLPTSRTLTPIGLALEH
jgi:hypothetical protein